MATIVQLGKLISLTVKFVLMSSSRAANSVTNCRVQSRTGIRVRFYNEMKSEDSQKCAFVGQMRISTTMSS